jgi:osmotically-inducible protein OsmY
VVGPPSSAGSRTNDTYITSKVKARFLQAKTFSPTHVKVHVAAANVYLLGIVTRAEADEAAQIASTTDGVAKVVRVFEYIDEGSAKQLDTRPPEDAREKK